MRNNLIFLIYVYFFINFKININRMYLEEQDVRVPLQNKFIKKNLCLKDLHSNDYLYNTLIKDNKIFNVNHKSIDQLNESFKF